MSNIWNLDDGLKLVRAIQQDSRRWGYHLALGGGVLNNGQSKKDIDLYFLPLDNDRVAKPDPRGLIDWLVKMWGPFEVIGGENYGAENQVSHSTILNEALEYRLNTTSRENDGPDLFAGTFASTLSYPSTTHQVAVPLKGPYQYKLKFNRNNDRIDVFII